MKMFSPKIGTPTVVAITVVMLLSLISVSNTYSFNKKVGGGQAAFELCAGYQSWADIPQLQQEQIRQLAIQAGAEYALLMLLGQHLPMSLLILFTVCIISKSASNEFKRFLRLCFLSTSLIGMFFLSLALSRTGQGGSFFNSLGTSFVVYLTVSILLWSAIGIGVLIRGKCGENREN